MGGPPAEYGVVQFDHLMHWVPELDEAVRDCQALGFTVQRAGQHPQFGTHNAGWRLDTRYIELIWISSSASASWRSSRSFFLGPSSARRSLMSRMNAWPTSLVISRLRTSRLAWRPGY